MIYIDPPYNTGKKKEFKYGDSWIDKNSGYKHSYWLSFINKRLEIAKNLLSKDGLIFISIDENEYARLKLLCDDIFTSSNFIGSFVKKISGGKNDSKTIKVNHEYLLCYKRTEKATIHLNIEYTKKDETRSLQKDGDNEERFNRENLWYPIYANIKTKEISLEFKKDMIEIFPIKNDGLERYWRWEYDTAVKRINELRLTKTKFDDGKIKYDIGVFTPKGTRKELPWNSFISDFSAGGGTQLKEVLGKKIAGMYPKNLDYIKWICNLSVKKNPIILDFFAGSGTTAQAVSEIRREINPEAKFIIVDQGEYFDTLIKPRVQKVNFCSSWKNGKPVNASEGLSSIFEVIKLESYEDALNNLELKKPKVDLFDNNPELKDDYLLNYMLDVESRGSLLSTDDFKKPFDYTMKIAVDSAGAFEEQKVDLVETFNYLIGLTVKHIDAQPDRGFVTVTGTLPSGETCLVLCGDVAWDELPNKRRVGIL